MNICTNPRYLAAQNWLNAHPKAKEWLWFVALWCVGLASVMAMAYPIKWLIRGMG